MISAVIAAAALITDQLSKAWVLRMWPQPYTGEIALIPGWLELTYIQNTGVAFGLFQGIPQFFTLTSLVIIAGAIWFYLTQLTDDRGGLALCLGLIVGGALGNVTDRIRFGYVVDFVKTFDGRFPVFNTADMFVVTGVSLMALLLARTKAPHSATSAAPPNGAPVEADDGR